MIEILSVKINPTVFPDKTSQVWKLQDPIFNYLKSNSVPRIKWMFENEAELLQIAQLRDLCTNPPILEIPYLPYARQDKEVSNDSTFALKSFSRLLNSLNFGCIETFDVHSNKAEKWINNFFNKQPSREIAWSIIWSKCDTICFPDSGAAERYSKYVPQGIDSVFGVKVRDQKTGEIIKYDFSSKSAKMEMKFIIPNLKGKNVLIVDDICDGGATFKLCAEKLYENGTKDVKLYVSHGIFSKGTKTLKDSGISEIYTKEGKVNE